MRSGQRVRRVNAVLATGGSVFGLQAVQGVMRYLEERKQGFRAHDFVVPIVTAASIFDPKVARSRPFADAGYQACVASSEKHIVEGAVGAGTGALAGKAYGPKNASKGGIGTTSRAINDTVVGALVVVNCLGCIVDPDTEQIVARPHHPVTGIVVCNLDEMISQKAEPQPWANDLVAVVATDLPLRKTEANELARIAFDGFPRVIRPTSSTFDSSVVFILSTAAENAEGASREKVGGLGSVATELVAEATVRAVMMARESTDGRG